MAPRRTPRGTQYAEASEQPAHDSDQESSSGAEEPIPGHEDEPQTNPFLQRALSRMSLADAALRIKVFTGEHPMLTARWLKRIETLYPEGSVWHSELLSMAEMRVQGKAKDVVDRAIPDNWEEFKKCLLEFFEPDAAVLALGEQLDDRSRYKGMPAMQALQQAATDRRDLRWFYGADMNDRSILIALKAIFPPTVLTLVGFKGTGDFDDLVKQLKEQVIIANARNDADSKWAREGQTQAFSTTPMDKEETVPAPSAPKYRRSRKNTKKMESAPAPPASNAEMRAEIHALREQVAKLAELFHQHHF
ncbi:hypothetical protein GQ54DRAFT_314464 [Martensiomyces pterosporus]|nr:hypothetical protein GQ54DRAFT_314464 [Martensiomyces pterosporus]